MNENMLKYHKAFLIMYMTNVLYSVYMVIIFFLHVCITRTRFADIHVYVYLDGSRRGTNFKNKPKLRVLKK